ncbi:M48 family metalloprotease [Allohahella marinimesophila]|uniref:M48 family metallopeptidase n=1 Tax=Allohahella marinimesophila TaxID=1054972 RepID=A0ABP7PL52_9GAMM
MRRITLLSRPPLRAPLIALPLVLTLTACTGSQFRPEQAAQAGAAAVQAATLSSEVVINAASEAAQQMGKQNKVAPESSTYAQRLRKLIPMTGANTDKYNFKVYLSDEVNAFAMADGTVRVYSKLMDLMSDDQVLAVLQHEIGHVELRHSYKQMREQLYTNAAFSAVAAAGGTIGQLSQSELGQLAAGYANARYSQSDELESDTFAVKALHRTGQPPQSMKAAIQTLQSVGGEGPQGLAAFLSSHPTSDRRIENIDETIKSLK